MAQYNNEHMAEQFKNTVISSDDSETDDESDKDYKFDKAELKSFLSDDRAFSDKDIIECMWKTVLDHKRGYIEGLASTTYLVCTMDGVHKPMIYNNKYSHAEGKLIKDLKENYKGPMKLTIYINNSPCALCAKKLKEFLEINQNIQLILHVTHLYNIKRKSCKLRGDAKKDEKHINCIESKVHKDQYLELRNLMSLGGNRCRIESFTKEVWEALLAVMDMSEESRKQIIQLYALKLKNHDRSRQCEDRRIRKDLNHIKSHSDPWHEI